MIKYTLSNLATIPVPTKYRYVRFITVIILFVTLS